MINKVPVFGFGGKPSFPEFTSSQIPYCFPCTGNITSSEVVGLSGIMEVYAYALQHVMLSGPKLFAPLIKQSANVAKLNKRKKNGAYSILLILTDGEIHDETETIDTIVAAAYLPLSIVIVGVGPADFKKMEILDRSDELVSSQGKKCVRDFVQFVAFRDFNDMVHLGREVLAEIPEQVVEYMKIMKVKPLPPGQFPVIDVSNVQNVENLQKVRNGNLVK